VRCAMADEAELKKWLGEVEKSRKGSVDLSRDEDLSVALMNLISLEEHFYFSHAKTQDDKYLKMLDSIRGLRKKLLGKIVTNPKGEEWCISKHLLAASMRLMEVGTKELAKKSEEDAKQYFQAAFALHSLFFALNLNITGVPDLEGKALQGTAPKAAGKAGEKAFLPGLSAAIAKIIDCCKE